MPKRYKRSVLTPMSHTSWDCTYHIVFCPKYRKKIIYANLKKQIGSILNKLLSEMSIEKLEGNLRPDHIHLLLKIPPSLSVSDVIGTLKGKSAIRLHNKHAKQPRKTKDKSFWSRGFFVRTTGLDNDTVQKYIRDQEDKDKGEDSDQLELIISSYDHIIGSHRPFSGLPAKAPRSAGGYLLVSDNSSAKLARELDKAIAVREALKRGGTDVFQDFHTHALEERGLSNPEVLTYLRGMPEDIS